MYKLILRGLFPILLALATWSIPLAGTAQVADQTLEAVIRQWFEQYQVPHYMPAKPIRLNSLNVDTKRQVIEIFANESFSSQPLTPTSVAQIYSTLSRALPLPYNTYKLVIYGKDTRKIEDLIPSYLWDKADETRRWQHTQHRGAPWVTYLNRPYDITRGLQGRHIALWASHGRYYRQDKGVWSWQRPNLYATNEDLFTQSIVVPYLIPMLERAGAIIYTPRERSWQVHEVIVDNDTPQTQGQYQELTRPNPEAPITTLGTGWSYDTQRTLAEGVNPFALGTARSVATTARASRTTTFVWTPEIPQEGMYPVYVSYPTQPSAVPDAVYTIHHAGIRTQVQVNQQIGGGTWVYLGTYRFRPGAPMDNRITLTNKSDYRGNIIADAVRLGGGIGNVVRGSDAQGNAMRSGYPRFAEGARYSAQWYGLPTSVYSSKNGTNDYADDINVRPFAVNYMAGGSAYVPHQGGKGIPLEMALAVHSDAGVAPQDGIYGSLSISTTAGNNGTQVLDAGVSRRTSADLAAEVLNTLTDDLSHVLGRPWTRRELWDRNYSETRNPELPAAIIETLSHQNFTDLTYGHDPHFKFALARALYKAILRYTQYMHHEKALIPQPLPVHSLTVTFADDEHVRLSWTPTVDALSPTAVPTGYVVYQRQGEGDFDNGTYVDMGQSVLLPIREGVMYSYKVTAVNAGGESLPSEILAAYKAPRPAPTILIVNAFDRLSGPAIVDNADSVGFDLRRDIGVAYGANTSFVGAQQNFDRTAPVGEGPSAIGYSGNELAGQVIAGNTFDYVASHGAAIVATGRYSFVSTSVQALTEGSVQPNDYPMLDLILGLQRFTPRALRYYKSFTPQLQLLLRKYTAGGGRLLLSGAYIASDMQLPEEQLFTRQVLKYQAAGTAQDTTGVIHGLQRQFSYTHQFNATQYAVQHPDRLMPLGGAFSAFAYADNTTAGIAYKGTDYRLMALAIPIESIQHAMDRAKIMSAALYFLLDK